MTAALRRLRLATLLTVLLVSACGAADEVADDANEPEPPPACAPVEPIELDVEVLRTLPHSPDAFTQGLLVHEGLLYESTGLVGRSSLRVLDPATGEEQRRVDVDADLFAEGLAVDAEDRLVQLTWTDEVALVWDRQALVELDRYDYDGEGWGLTTLDDGTFVMSDGSADLTWRDGADFSVLERRQVDRVGGPADQLNELEWDGEHLWANRFRTDELVRIDLECALVDAVADLSPLRGEAQRTAAEQGDSIDVTNGVAHLPGTDRYLVTGKLWPTMYEVRLLEPGERP